MIRNFIRQSQPWTKNIKPGSIANIRLCDKKPHENIDSHESLLTKKNNYNYSIQIIVDDYNDRWKKNITVKEYLDNFTRKHRGAC